MFFTKTRRRTNARDQKLQGHSVDIGDVDVVRGVYYPSLGKKKKNLESWRRLHVGDIDGTSCQRLQVMMTQLLQKHWEWQENRRPMMRHRSVIRPTMYLASMDIKMAFDVARPKHIARIVEDHDVHGWIIAAFLREMAGLEGQATFECVESKFSLARCTRQGSVEPPQT